MTKVLARTIEISPDNERFLFDVANIESPEVVNWCNAAGFSFYAEDVLKRYCLRGVTSIVQQRGNLYRDSRLAKQLETIARGVECRCARMRERRIDRRAGGDRPWRRIRK
jgi:hypothetical protein